jgi:hypothetical protein
MEQVIVVFHLHASCLKLLTEASINLYLFCEQSMNELIEMAQKYYDDVALPKLVRRIHLLISFSNKNFLDKSFMQVRNFEA